VILINWGDEPFHIQPGDRIAQLLIIGAQLPELAAVDVLPEAADERGAGGFGSSGGFSGA
jgi:dUTP pyrophosphatase